MSYVVTCPLLPELITEGDSVAEVLQNANDTLAAIIEAFADLKRPLPPMLRPAHGSRQIWASVSLASTSIFSPNKTSPSLRVL
jgi:antitoxin HicB